MSLDFARCPEKGPHAEHSWETRRIASGWGNRQDFRRVNCPGVTAPAVAMADHDDLREQLAEMVLAALVNTSSGWKVRTSPAVDLLVPFISDLLLKERASTCEAVKRRLDSFRIDEFLNDYSRLRHWLCAEATWKLDRIAPNDGYDRALSAFSKSLISAERALLNAAVAAVDAVATGEQR